MTAGRLRTPVLVTESGSSGVASIVGLSGCSVPTEPGVVAWLDCGYLAEGGGSPCRSRSTAAPSTRTPCARPATDHRVSDPFGAHPTLPFPPGTPFVHPGRRPSVDTSPRSRSRRAPAQNPARPAARGRPAVRLRRRCRISRGGHDERRRGRLRRRRHAHRGRQREGRELRARRRHGLLHRRRVHRRHAPALGRDRDRHGQARRRTRCSRVDPGLRSTCRGRARSGPRSRRRARGGDGRPEVGAAAAARRASASARSAASPRSSRTTSATPARRPGRPARGRLRHTRRPSRAAARRVVLGVHAGHATSGAHHRSRGPDGDLARRLGRAGHRDGAAAAATSSTAAHCRRRPEPPS